MQSRRVVARARIAVNTTHRLRQRDAIDRRRTSGDGRPTLFDESFFDRLARSGQCRWALTSRRCGLSKMVHGATRPYDRQYRWNDTGCRLDHLGDLVPSKQAGSRRANSSRQLMVFALRFRETGGR